MVGLQSSFVGFAKRCGQLFGFICLDILKRLAGELLTTKEPQQPLCRLPLLLTLLVLYQFFQGVRQGGRLIVPRTDFLQNPGHGSKHM